ILTAQRFNAVDNYDDEKANEVLKVLAKNETWQIPTLALYRSTRSKENFTHLPDSIRIKWENGLQAMENQEPSPDSRKYTDWMLKMTGKIHQYEIDIMAGTDTPIGFLTPGLSLHEELSQLVEAGLSPLEALKTATLNPAIYFDLETELGWIGENTWADLVILTANPLEDISNTKQIDAVLKQGSYFDRNVLNQTLEKVRKN
ncbi:MAG: amidohydrolase family protein, partial [Flavobacteriaceae bacterium]|nr:amidohydrolase family protein [Flavobacteriaceae bacterium]